MFCLGRSAKCYEPDDHNSRAGDPPCFPSSHFIKLCKANKVLPCGCDTAVDLQACLSLANVTDQLLSSAVTAKFTHITECRLHGKAFDRSKTLYIIFDGSVQSHHMSAVSYSMQKRTCLHNNALHEQALSNTWHDIKITQPQ